MDWREPTLCMGWSNLLQQGRGLVDNRLRRFARLRMRAYLTSVCHAVRVREPMHLAGQSRCAERPSGAAYSQSQVAFHLRSDEGLAGAELLRGVGVLVLELLRRHEIRARAQKYVEKTRAEWDGGRADLHELQLAHLAHKFVELAEDGTQRQARLPMVTTNSCQQRLRHELRGHTGLVPHSSPRNRSHVPLSCITKPALGGTLDCSNGEKGRFGTLHPAM